MFEGIASVRWKGHWRISFTRTKKAYLAVGCWRHLQRIKGLQSSSLLSTLTSDRFKCEGGCNDKIKEEGQSKGLLQIENEIIACNKTCCWICCEAEG